MRSCQVTFGDTLTSKNILYEVMSGNHGDTLTSKDILYEVMSGNHGDTLTYRHSVRGHVR